MIKSAFKVYGKNIWDVFAILGFISLGVFVGIFVTVPVINNLVYNTYNKVVSAATGLGQGFTLDAFIKSLNNQINALDWANPIRTIRMLFENNGIYNIIVNALKAGNLKPESITQINNVLINSVNTLTDGLKTEITLFLTCVIVASLIGYIGNKIVIQIRSTYDHHFVRFICSFFLNILILCLIYFLILLALVNVTGVVLFLSLLGIFMLMLLLTFLSAILVYKKKEVKFFDIFNIKSNLGLVLSSLIIFSLSSLLIIVVFIFSDVIAIILSLSLFIITMIIIENIVINFVTGYKKKTIEIIKESKPKKQSK